LKSTVEAMSGIYAQLIGQDVGVLPLVEACNKILDYVLENGFGGGSSNPLTPAQLEKIKKDVIDRIKTQVPMGVLLKDCELVDSKLKYTLSDNSNKELDLATLINKSVKNYVDTHKSELKGDRGLKGEQGVAGVNGKSAYDIWKEKGNTGTEQDFLNSFKGQNGNDGIGITNIEKVGDKLKITLSNGQIKEFTLPSGGSGTTGLTEEQVKTLINTLYKPQIDSKLERGSLDKNITADQLKKSIDKNTDKLTQTITDLKLVGDKLKYKENGIEKSILLPSGSGGLTTSQVKQIIDTDYVPTINSKLEKGHYTGNATDLEKNINNKADKIELQNYAKKTDISEFIKGTDADTKYNTKKEFNKLKDVATTELSLEGKNLKFKENGVEKTITLPASSEGSGLNEAQVKAIVDRDYKPSIDNKIDKSEYQAKIAVLETTVSSKQDASTALKLTDVKNEIKKVVGTAPETLDTLQEIAQALGNDPNKINTILSQLGLKASQKDLDTFKEKTITELKFNNNKITYKENGISKEIDLSSYVNPTTQAIETIVENKGNTLFEHKDNTIVKNLAYNGASKKITYTMNNVNKEIEFSSLKGKDGVGLDFNWQGTKLGVKKSTETNYNYIDLKGSQGQQGTNGVGIKEISLIGNNLNIKLDTDEIKTVTLPLLKGEQGIKGNDGTGISNITSSGSELTVSLTDGSNKKFTIPTIKGDKGENGLNGAKGADGVSISSISTVGTKLVIDTTDGQHKELTVPTVKGDKGDKISEVERLADLQKLWNENLKFLTIEEYNALAQKDPNIIYVLIRSA